MKRTTAAALFVATLFSPAAVWAQTTPPSANACDQLLTTIDRLGAQQSQITRQQALDFQSKGDTAGCSGALLKLNPQAANTAAGSNPNVQVTQAAPQVTVTQQPPTVTVNQGQPQITIHQPAPIVTVEIPPPDVTILLPTPGVSVSQPQPQVAVTEAKPQVNVVPPSQQAQTITSAQQNPVVQYNADKAQVTVKQSDQPTVHVEQQAAASSSQPSNQPQQQTAQNQTAQPGGANQLQPKPVAASDLIGKDVMTAANSNVGMITEVVVDSKNQPFVIVDKNGKQYEVDVHFTYMKGNNLLLNTTADPSTLPAWTDSQLASGMRKLTGAETVTVAQSAG